MDKARVKELLKNATITFPIDLDDKLVKKYKKEAKKIGVSTEDLISAILMEAVQKEIDKEKKAKEEDKKEIVRELKWIGVLMFSLFFSIGYPIAYLVKRFLFKEVVELNAPILLLILSLTWLGILLFTFKKTVAIISKEG